MKAYLLAYNTTLFVSWSLLFIYWIATGWQLDTFSLALLNFSQLAAILEIFHAHKGWVKTPVLTAFLQIFSRVFVLMLINILPFEHYWSFFGINGLHLIMIAWCITEIVRYSFYALNLIDQEWSVLRFLRYSLFLALYPLGVTGELLIIASAFYYFLPSLGLLGTIGAIIIYIIFFPKMYGHMLNQRRKKLGNVK